MTVGSHFSIERNSAGSEMAVGHQAARHQEADDGDKVVLPLFGFGRCHEQDRAMNRRRLMYPSKQYPQRDGQRLVMAQDNVPLDAPDEGENQRAGYRRLPATARQPNDQTKVAARLPRPIRGGVPHLRRPSVPRRTPIDPPPHRDACRSQRGSARASSSIRFCSPTVLSLGGVSIGVGWAAAGGDCQSGACSTRASSCSRVPPAASQSRRSAFRAEAGQLRARESKLQCPAAMRRRRHGACGRPRRYRAG